MFFCIIYLNKCKKLYAHCLSSWLLLLYFSPLLPKMPLRGGDEGAAFWYSKNVS